MALSRSLLHLQALFLAVCFSWHTGYAAKIALSSPPSLLNVQRRVEVPSGSIPEGEFPHCRRCFCPLVKVLRKVSDRVCCCHLTYLRLMCSYEGSKGYHDCQEKMQTPSTNVDLPFVKWLWIRLLGHSVRLGDYRRLFLPKQRRRKSLTKYSHSI